MEAVRCLSLLAVRPVLDQLPSAGLDPQAGERLTKALGVGCARAWKAAEVILAGPGFWDGCRVFLSPDECRSLRQYVDRLRAEALPAEAAKAEDLRKDCLREWHAADRAGLLVGNAPDLPALLAAVGTLNGGSVDRLSDGERKLADRLAGELRGAGFPALARLATADPAGVPVLVTAARFFFAQLVEADADLARRLGWQAREPAGEREKALAALGRTLTAHGRGLQEWLDEEAARPVHAHASSGTQAPAPQRAPAAGKEGWQEPAAPPDRPAPAAAGKEPLSGRQRFWGLVMPLVALAIPVAAVLWLVYGHAVNEVRQLVGHKSGVTSIAFSPDGKLALTGSGDRTVRLWDVATGAELKCLEGHGGDIYSVAFSPDGRRAASGGMDSVRLWDLETGKQLRRLDTPTNFVLCVAFSRDGRQIFSTSKADNVVRVWDVETGKEVRQMKGHTGPVQGVACSPDGKYVASAGDESVRVWDAATGKELHCFTGKSKDRVNCVAFAPDSQFVVAGSSDGKARLWSLETGKEALVFSGHTTPVVAVAFSPDGRSVATGSLGPVVRNKEKEGSPILSEQHPLRVWNAYSGRESAYLEAEGELNGIWSVAFSPDGRYLLSSGPERVVRLWQMP